MNHRHLTVFLVAGFVLTASALGGDTFVETFDDGSNEGGWQWGTGNEQIVPFNGNPGAFLQDLTINSCCPVVFTAPGLASEFTGDYRQLGIVSVAVDLITLDADFSVAGRPLTLMLINNNGTVNNVDDDFGVLFIGDKNIPDAGTPGATPTPAGWTDFVFAIPAQATTTPTGWFPFRFDGTFGGDTEWNAVMTDVDRIEFFYAIPGLIYPFFSWDLGLDNPRITTGSSVPGACCFAGGECLQFNEPDCVTAGGVYQGEGVPCEDETCVPTGAVGACCDPSTGDCLVTSEALCVAGGGQYQGDETTCGPDTCEPAIDPCGQPDAGNCCGSNLTAGCNNADCCDLVCSVAPFCCEVIWTGQCVDLAFELCSSCGPTQRTMIVKQGTCPAPVNLSSFGFVQTVLAGDVDFNVDDVVLGSLELRRCDGPSGSAAPIAELTHTLDLNHPVEGTVTCSSCACNEDQSSDGIDDLMLKFATSNLFFLSPDDGQVTLELSGQLTDGSEFIARDCVTIVPPQHVVAANIEVQSDIAGTLIETSPPDRNNDSGGFTNLGLAYTPNTQVAFTAPASWDDVSFSRWIVDGVPQPLGQQTVSVQVNSQTVVRAGFQCDGDLDGDDLVGIADFLLILAQWGSCPSGCPGDIDGDGETGVTDLLILLANWGPCH